MLKKLALFGVWDDSCTTNRFRVEGSSVLLFFVVVVGRQVRIFKGALHILFVPPSLEVLLVDVGCWNSCVCVLAVEPPSEWVRRRDLEEISKAAHECFAESESLKNH